MLLAGSRIFFAVRYGRLVAAPLIAVAIPNRMLGECGWTCAVDNTFGQPAAKA